MSTRRWGLAFVLLMSVAPIGIGGCSSDDAGGAPMLDRPEALSALAPSGAAPNGSVRELTPEMFGAKGGDPEADTNAWNKAFEKASKTGQTIRARGKYALRVSNRSTWNWANRVGNPVYVAVELRSGVHVVGENVEIIVAPQEPFDAKNPEPEHVLGNEGEYKPHHFLFGTAALNVEPGTLHDISFEGVNVDFRSELGEVHRPMYAFAPVGVDDFERRNLTIQCSDAFAGGGPKSSHDLCGRGLLGENNRRRRDTNVTMNGLEQGIYTHYERGVVMEGISMNGFTEGLDFDGPSWDVSLKRLRFQNAFSEAQCIDTGGGANWVIDDVEADTVGAIAFIYNKPNAFKTYRMWLDAQNLLYTDDWVPAENFTISNVVGRNVGKGRNAGKSPGKEEVLRVGSLRSRSQKTHGGPPPKNITIKNWKLTDTYRISVNDCVGLDMRNIELDNVKTNEDAVDGAAFVFREAKREEPDPGDAVTGSVFGLRIRNSQGMGVSAMAGPRLEIEKVSVEGFNAQASLITNAGIRLRPRPGTSDLPTLIVGEVDVTGGQPGDPKIDRPK